MRDNTLTVDASKSPGDIIFAPNFNVAVPFIDRHLEEGRIRSRSGGISTM